MLLTSLLPAVCNVLQAEVAWAAAADLSMVGCPLPLPTTIQAAIGLPNMQGTHGALSSLGCVVWRLGLWLRQRRPAALRRLWQPHRGRGLAAAAAAATGATRPAAANDMGSAPAPPTRRPPPPPSCGAPLPPRRRQSLPMGMPLSSWVLRELRAVPCTRTVLSVHEFL
jgi:hypothetical protein